MSDRPVCVALIDDYHVIQHGLRSLLSPHADLVEILDMVPTSIPDRPVDVALIDCFGRVEAPDQLISTTVAAEMVGRVAVYTWSVGPALVERALAAGATSYLSKAMPGALLAAGLVDTHRGRQVISESPRAQRPATWGRSGEELTLSDREADVLAHICQGRTNQEIADALFLGVNSVKTHTQNLYRKIGVSTRTQAALWGSDHGFRADRTAHIHGPS